MSAEVYPSEEKTEPFTPEELYLRLGKSIEVDELDDAQYDSIPLDHLVVDEHHHEQGLRILVRPLTRSRSISPGNDNCRWLALGAEVGDPNQPKSKVLAVTQTSKDINFSIRIPQTEDEDRPPLWCELYYDPASDSLILWNKSEIPIALARTSPSSHLIGSNFNVEILPGATRELSPCTWRITVGIPVLDFRILERRPAVLHVPSDSFESSPALSQDMRSSLGKRTLSDEFVADNAGIEKRLRAEDTQERNNDGVIIFLGPKDEPLASPLPNAGKTKEIAIADGHVLLEVQKDETVAIPGGCEIDSYQLTKRDQIATTGASSVFTAEHSHVPGGVITVKVLKTRGPQTDARPQDVVHRNVIRQADVWLREYQSQEGLKHESIVKLYGGDARHLSLYMEHVDAKDLTARNVWRDVTTDKFVGGRTDAVRILRDIAGALNYLHQDKRIHNDIKPANILYSRERGAVLCDFGLSTRTVDPATNGGTPYYVPPEFIGQKLRGPASDVWALGVTLLYVMRKIPFPDARGRKGHPRQLYWVIADLNRKHGHPSRGPTAVTQMQQWLRELNEAKGQLNPRDKIEYLTLQMLIPNPNQRITMAKVLNELRTDKEGALAR